MSESVARILADISRLSPEEQQELSDEFVRFNSPPDEMPSDELDAVLARRLEEMSSGKVKGVPADEAFAKLRQRRA